MIVLQGRGLSMLQRLLVWVCCLSFIGCSLQPLSYSAETYESMLDPNNRGGHFGSYAMLDAFARDGCSGKVPQALPVAKSMIERWKPISIAALELEKERLKASQYYALTCLQQAILNEQIDVIDWVLSEESFAIDINTFLNGNLFKNEFLPLRAAVDARNVLVVDHLLQRGALLYSVVAATGKPMYSAMNHAAELGDIAMIELMLAYGGDPNIYFDGVTPLLAAIDEGHIDLAKYLIDHGAYISYSQSYLKAPVTAATEAGLDDFADYLVGLGAIDARKIREDERLAAEQRSRAAMSKFVSSVGDVLGFALGVALIGVTGYYSGYTPAVAPKPDVGRNSYSSPRPIIAPRPQRQELNLGCSSDFGCGAGYMCVKQMYASSGECTKIIDNFGAPLYLPPNPNSIGVKTRGQCLSSSDCPGGFRCDLPTQACVR